MATERLHAALSRLDERLARVTIGELGDLAEVLDEARDALRAVAPPAEHVEHVEPTAEQQVRGVQAWMALDLHMALGLPVDHSDDVEHQGRRSWSDWWAELLHRVRVLPKEPTPPAELTEARCPSCDHLTEGHTEDGCWHFVDLCPCALPHGKPTTTPEES